MFFSVFAVALLTEGVDRNNYATYSQSLARIHRIGQRNTCTYIHLVAENTVDSTILKSLSKKEDLAKTVVDDWRQFF